MTLEAEGDDEEDGLQALIQHTRNALAAIHAEHLPAVEWAALMPEEPPAATLGFLIGMDSLEHMSERDREVLSNRARMRWTALREACRSSKPAGDAL